MPGERKDKLRGYFDELAGRFGRNYVPGRSWQGLSEMFLKLMPQLIVADLGAGEGTLSLLLTTCRKGDCRRSLREDARIRRRYRSENGVKNLEYRLGDLEDLPISDSEVDLALLHQSLHHAIHPDKAVAEAARI